MSTLNNSALHSSLYTAPNEQLCQTCQTAFGGDFHHLNTSDAWLDDKFRLHHPNTQSFQTSVRDRCRFCAEIWEEFSHVYADNLEPAMTIICNDDSCWKAPTVHDMEVKYLSLWILFDTPDAQRHDGFELPSPVFVGGVSYINAHDVAFTLVPVTPSIPQIRKHFTSNTSDRCHDLVPYWLKTCLEDHEICRRKPPQGISSPSRVLDVGKTGEELVRLHDFGIEELKDGYLTLSHTWGQDPSRIPRLSANNIGKWKAGIDYRTLPRTFRHAIELTRELKRRYLWLE
jgi:hypothetical protein